MYKTGFLKTKVQVIESILTQLPQQTQKIKFTLRFQDEQKLKQFLRIQKQRKQQQAQYQSLSDSQEQIQDSKKLAQRLNETIPAKLIVKKSTEKVQKLHQNQIKVSIQQSVIYKTHFQKQFQQIGKQYNLTINIRIQKIIFTGYDIENIQDAIQQVNNIKDFIYVEYISKSGLEISQSKQLVKMYDDVGIKIIKIIDKYYRWYKIDQKLTSIEQKNQKKKIEQVIRKVNSSHHCIQYLSLIDQDISYQKGNQKYQIFTIKPTNIPYRFLFQSLKSQIFQDQLQFKLNKSLNLQQKQIQLSLSKQALIFHSDIFEYMQINIKQIKNQYQLYDYFYITIGGYYQIEKVIELFEKYKYDVKKLGDRKYVMEEEKQINYLHYNTNYQYIKMKKSYCDEDDCYSVIFCIAYKKKNWKNVEFLEEIITQLYELWNGANFQISINISNKSFQLDDPRISFQKSLPNRVFHMNANQSNLQTYLFILKQYIITNKFQNTNLLPRDKSFELSAINLSNIINDSTILNEKTLSQVNNNSSIFEQNNGFNMNFNINEQNNLLADLDNDEKQKKFNEILKNYQVYLEQTSKDYNNKYEQINSPEINKIIKTDKRNKPLEEQIYKITKSKYYAFKIKLNLKHKAKHFYGQSKDSNQEIVSVFVNQTISPFVKPQNNSLKDSSVQFLYNSFPVSLFLNNQNITENGYLLNVRKKDITFMGRTFRVEYGKQFEVAKMLENLKNVKKV